MFKRVLLTSILGTVMTIFGAVAEPTAEDLKTASSKAYVDTAVATKQVKIPAAGQTNGGSGETVMTYTVNGNGEIGERGLYSDASSYNPNTDGDKLITASALNATFTNLPTTDTTKLECANQDCTLWTIVDQSAYSILPAGYTQLEYIESTGTQYINTGIKYRTSEHVRYIADFKMKDYTVSGLWGGMGGRRTGTIWLYSNQFRISMGGTVSSSSQIRIPFDTNRHVVTFDAGLTPSDANISLLFDEGVYEAPYTYMEDDIGRDKNIMLFTGYTADYSPAKMKVYKFQIYLDNVLVFNGVPAKSGNSVGMYDTVSDTFKLNIGTGEFTAGPAINVYIPQEQQ
ncbi:MAG: hypothetical protein J5714_02020 [Alphaproteobacteria bacterium]|nr:hypothetical protein [Alphaproteobacteria bacterium]